MSISQLQKVFTDQIDTIKAIIKSLSGVEKVSIGESSIDKKDHTVIDPTGSIRVVFWGDYCEKEVVKDNTYTFKRFRYRSNKFGNYINTLKDGTCSAKIEFVVSVTARCSNCKGLNKLKNCINNLYMKILVKNEKEEKLSLSLFHQTILKMLALVNKDRDYQELSIEEIELAVAEIDSINA